MSVNKNRIRDELRRFQFELRGQSLTDEVREMSSPSLARGLLAYIFDWIVIFCSVRFTSESVWFFPIALIVIGSRQRALYNLVHDASHWNLSGRGLLNDLLSNLLASYPLLDSVTNYRIGHRRHHEHLGDANFDPDHLTHLKYGYDDANPWADGAVRDFSLLIFNQRAWLDSVFGSLRELTLSTKILSVGWWVLAAGTLSLFDMEFAAWFLFLWALARATTYHIVRLFAEFMDHTGLQPGTILSFTRTIAGAGPLRYLLHAHSDHYHLVHHLLPSIPHYRLRRMHGKLVDLPIYAAGHHCDGYVWGKRTAIQSWQSGKTGFELAPGPTAVGKPSGSLSV